MRNPWLTLLASSLLLAPAAAAPLLVERFDNGSGIWEAHGCDGGPLSDGLHAADGLALRIDYTATPGFHAAALQVQQSFKGARTVRFWVRTSHDAMLLAVLQEENEATYATMLYSPAATGQAIELGLDRFTLWADSHDDNDRLDLDRLKLVAIADVSGELKGVLDGPGARSMWLDDFEVQTEPPARAYSQDGLLPLRLADERGGVWSWLPLVGQLSVIPAQGLQWNYDGAPGLEAFQGINAIGLLLGQLPAEGATHLLLTIASERPATFAVVLQEAKSVERNESRYLHPLHLAGDGQVATLALPLADFVIDPEQGDENSRLDLDQVHLLLLADVETGLQKLAAPNQILIEAVELVGAQ